MNQGSESSAATGSAGTTAPRWAWLVCWLMFAATSLNYMDRQTVSLVRPQLREAFHIQTDAEFGWVLSAFIMIYALFQAPAGYLVDRFDLGRCYAFAVAFWSLAAVATAFAPSLGFLIVCRALLGVGESFNWPCALRVTGRVLPPSARGLGNGIFNSGAAVGAVLTPLVVTYLVTAYNWRAAFLAVGVLGFVWVVVWLFAIQGPRRGDLARREEPLFRIETSTQPVALHLYAAYFVVGLLALVSAISALWFGMVALWLAVAVLVLGPPLAALGSPHDPRLAPWARSLAVIARLRSFWLVALASVSINLCWHFLINWVPSFLNADRGFDYQSSNYLSMIPFLAADLGNLGGGWLSRQLSRHGSATMRGRFLILVLGTLLATAGPWVGLVQNQSAVIVLVALMAAGTAAFMAVYFAFAQEVSIAHAGLVVGYLGAIGNLAVAGFQPLAGHVKDVTGSFAPVFVLVGLLPIVALAALAGSHWLGDTRSRAQA